MKTERGGRPTPAHASLQQRNLNSPGSHREDGRSADLSGFRAPDAAGFATFSEYDRALDAKGAVKAQNSSDRQRHFPQTVPENAVFLRHRKLIQLSLLAGLSIASASVCAHAALNLPTARQVLERYVKATGGREALLKHQSMTIHGRYQVPSRKLDFETVTYMKSGKALWKFLLPDGKEYVSGYTGKIAWDMDSSGKVTIHHGDIVKSVARDADMYYHLHVMKYFRTMAVVDIQEFNDHLCYHLKGVNKWGQVNEHFYDTRSGLLQGYAFNTAWRGGKGNATVLFDDYKNFGGVLMPAKTVSHEDGDVAISLISAVTYDDVPDALFELPEAVKKAMAAAKDKQREKAG